LFILAGYDEEIEAEITPDGEVFLVLMSQIDYAAMSDQELKQYFLAHREDEVAFQAYLERRRQRSSGVIAKVGDPDFDAKIEAAIQQKLQSHQATTERP
jgi:hypothetical protein